MKHTGPISGIATRGNLVATAGYDNQVILWDGRTHTSLASAKHAHLANQCDFSADGKYVVSASSDYTANIWKLPSMQLHATLAGHPDDVDMAMFSPSSQYVATCARGDYGIRIFDVEGALQKILLGHTDYITSLAWAADEREIISSSDDGTIRRWDVTLGCEIASIDVNGVQTETAVISTSGTVFAGDDLGRIVICSGDNKQSIAAHQAGIKRIVLHANERLLASSSYDGYVIVWDIALDGQLTQRSKTKFPSIVWPRSASFLQDNKLVFGTFGSSYAVYDYVAETWETNHIEPDSSVNAVCTVDGEIYTIGDAGILAKEGRPISDLGSLCNFLLPVNGRILTGGQLGIVFDAVSGEILHQHRSPINCGVAYQLDGVWHAALGSYTGEAIVFKSDADGIRFLRTVTLHENAIKGLAADEHHLFSACATAAVAWHDLATFTPVQTLEKAHTEIANGCTVVKNGFASIGRDRKMRLWFRGEYRCIDTPHENSIKCITSDTSGRFLLSGSYAGMLALYDLETERWTEILRLTTSGISSVCYDAVNERFCASAYDGSIHVVSTRRYAKTVSLA